MSTGRRRTKSQTVRHMILRVNLPSKGGIATYSNIGVAVRIHRTIVQCLGLAGLYQENTRGVLAGNHSGSGATGFMLDLSITS